jgi:hypothetical protein
MDAGAVLDMIPGWVTLLMIAVGVWRLVPRPLRNSVEIGPVLAAFLDWLKPVALEAGRAFEAFAFQVLTGKPREAPADTVNHSELPALPPPPVMSHPETPPGGTGTGTTILPEPEPLRNLTDREVAEALAAWKRADTWVLSANEIYAIVKGSRNDVLRWVREVRAAEPELPASVTPIAERETRAAFHEHVA